MALAQMKCTLTLNISQCIIGFGSSPSRCGPRGHRPVVIRRYPGSRARRIHTCQGIISDHAESDACSLSRAHPSCLPPVRRHRRSDSNLSWLNGWPISPCRRFAPGLAAGHAGLGTDADHYSFIAVDLHHLLLAGLPAHLTLKPPLFDRSLSRSCLDHISVSLFALRNAYLALSSIVSFPAILVQSWGHQKPRWQTNHTKLRIAVPSLRTSDVLEASDFHVSP
jgi:hypothetical protein